MQRKARIDATGAALLVGFAFLFALNQVAIKVANGGFQPVFMAALRSVIALACLWPWLAMKGRAPRFERRILPSALLIGGFFAAEFLFLFVALDLTTVTRSVVVFYSMPVWLALAGHFLLPDEPLTTRRIVGLAIAFGGVAWAIVDRGGDAGTASVAGDLCALAAACSWAGIVLTAKATRMREEPPERQLFWQLVVSAPILIVLAPFFGPFLRDIAAIHVASLLFQAVIVVTLGFMVWMWLLAVYPASGVASFAFLTPVIGIALGWLWLGEQAGPDVLGAGALVVTGLVLINRPANPPPGRS